MPNRLILQNHALILQSLCLATPPFVFFHQACIINTKQVRGKNYTNSAILYPIFVHIALVAINKPIYYYLWKRFAFKHPRVCFSPVLLIACHVVFAEVQNKSVCA